MRERLRPIIDSIRNHIDQASHSLTQFDQYSNYLLRLEVPHWNRYLHFFLKTACEYNLVHLLHDLLELNVLNDINIPMEYTLFDFHQSFAEDNGKTLLGIAAFNGHQEMVRYLIAVQGAKVDGTDRWGNTALHQVVYGDSHPYKHGGRGSNHALVAEDLIFRYDADLNVKNHSQLSASDECFNAGPWKIERLLTGKRIISTGSAAFYGDQVRPPMQKKLDQLEWIHKMSQGRRINVVVVSESPCKKQPFVQFCTDFAIEAYIKRNQLTMGFKTIHDLVGAILAQSEGGRKHALAIINTFKPEPGSGFRFPNEDNIRCGILIGVLVSAVVYTLLGSLELSLASVLVAGWIAMLKSMNRTSHELSQKSSNEMYRAQTLQLFFSPPAPHGEPSSSFENTAEVLQR